MERKVRELFNLEAGETQESKEAKAPQEAAPKKAAKEAKAEKA